MTYLAVAGLPGPTDEEDAEEVSTHELVRRALCFAADIIHAASEIACPNCPGARLQLRVGVHVGPATSGVIGRRMPRYCLFGSSVPTASRLESSGVPNHVQMTSETRALAVSPPPGDARIQEGERAHMPWDESSGWRWKRRIGGVVAKGLGRLDTWFLAPPAHLDFTRSWDRVRVNLGMRGRLG